MFDVAKVRKDFPILEEQVYGKRLVYLDNGATTQRPLQVIEKMNEYYLKYNSNVHRGVHFLSNKCTDANEEAREIVRKFIHAGSDKEIIFTRGTTESINLVAFSFGEAFIREGDEILVTEMEHHANIVPWQMLCERKGAVLKVLPFNDKGELDLSQLDTLLTPRVKLVGVAYVSNVLGTVNPVKELIGRAHRIGAKVLVDGAQAVQHIPIDVQALDCDFSGKEMLQQALLDAPKFGNDKEEADEIAVRLHEFICQTIRSQKNRTRLDSFLAVLINNNMNVTLGQFVGATPDGRNAHKFLSNGNSPYNGQDKEGLTALILSLTKLDNSIHAGGNQNLKFARSMFEGDLTQIKSVLGTFFDLGGQQVNLSVVCQKDLEDALVHPESHENLVVRVGGFTARFIDLDKKTQQDVLTRTAYC